MTPEPTAGRNSCLKTYFLVHWQGWDDLNDTWERRGPKSEAIVAVRDYAAAHALTLPAD